MKTQRTKTLQFLTFFLIAFINQQEMDCGHSFGATCEAGLCELGFSSATNAAVVHRGFNCVRLTWSTFMFTRNANLKFGKTFDSLGLEEAKKRVARNNPFVLNMTHVQAYEPW